MKHVLSPAVRSGCSIVLLAGMLCWSSGCSVWENRPRLRKQEIKLDASTDGVPPIRMDSIDEHLLLAMQAPNAGWGIEFDKDERTPVGYRILITVRTPDPTFLYPQAIVEKTLLTELPSSAKVDIYARVLGAHEESKRQGYGLITPFDYRPADE